MWKLNCDETSDRSLRKPCYVSENDERPKREKQRAWSISSEETKHDGSLGGTVTPVSMTNAELMQIYFAKRGRRATPFVLNSGVGRKRRWFTELSFQDTPAFGANNRKIRQTNQKTKSTDKHYFFSSHLLHYNIVKMVLLAHTLPVKTWNSHSADEL